MLSARTLADDFRGFFGPGQRVAMLLAFAWTLTLALSFAWTYYAEETHSYAIGLQKARALALRDVMYRKWNSSVGGVWADADRIAPNPYLADMVKNRDVATTNGLELTLVNPAYMTRMVFDIQRRETDIGAKLTSLKPVNPANAPDAWETQALQQASTARLEISEILRDTDELRYLRALETEESCLSCHRKQGYRVGDIRGGISISLPLRTLREAAAQSVLVLFVSHLVIWLLGLLGIGYGYRNWLGYERNRQAGEAALRESQAHFRGVVDSALDSIVTMDHTGKIAEFNPAAERTFGYSRNEAIGRKMSELIIPPKWREMHEAGLARYLSTGQAKVLNQRLELTALRRDGSEFPVELTIAVERDSQGRPFFSGYLRDIGERKRAEAALLEAKEGAEAANRAKSAFLANMSHEIRTPLNAITGMAHLLRRAGATPEQADRLDKIDVAGQHLIEIVNAVLDLSKIEAGQFALEEANLSIESIFDNVRAMIQPQAERKGLRIELDVAPMPAGLRGDPTRIRQALLNFAGNAVKFTERGSIVLRARCLATSENATQLRCEVEDSGIGIAPEALSRLFMAFEQADNSITRKYGGTGLGLALTRKFAQLMGGDAGAESVPGAGSTFWFTCRLKIDPSGHAATPEPAVAAARVPPAAEAAPQEGAAAALAQRLASVPGLNAAAGLGNLGGKSAAYERLLRKYVAGHGEDMALLRAKLAAGAREDARRIAHSLKGVSATLGAEAVRRSAAELEAGIKAGHGGGELESPIAATAAAFARLAAAVREALGAETAAIAGELDWTQVRERLDILERLLREDDIGTNAAFREAAPLLRQALGERANELERHIERYAYVEALEILNAARMDSADGNRRA